MSRTDKTETAPRTPDNSEGFVFAVTSPKYNILARRAARTLRLVMPDAQIDLFTDEPLEDPVFDKVHMVQRSWHRPRMEAIRNTRFERSIFLDADLMVLSDISDVFEILRHFDFTGTHAHARNRQTYSKINRGLPPAFPQINAGVLGIRKSEKTKAMAQRWEDIMTEREARLDQAILRRVLYESDLRIHVLPPEYNLMAFHTLMTWGPQTNAPRILHRPNLHKREDQGDPMTPYDIRELLGPAETAHLKDLMAADYTLGGDPTEMKKTWRAPKWKDIRSGEVSYALERPRKKTLLEKLGKRFFG